MKLELKHLAPYLPYNLKMIHKMAGKVNGINYKPINLTEKYHQLPNSVLANFKPILRPLSDFYDINAPAFINTNFDIPTQLVLVDLCSKKQHYSGIKYSDMQEFLKYNIDVFNLI